MDHLELDQAVNRQIEQAYWPWWFAFAYVQPKPERYDAMRGAVETYLAFKGSSVDAVGAFGRVVAVMCGEDDPDSETFRTWQARAEDRLLLAVRAGKVATWGRLTPSDGLVELKPSDWVGGEVDCSNTCDLVKEGWRDANWLSQVFDLKRIVRYSDVHLPREQVMAWVDHLESEKARADLDDMFAGDYDAFVAIEREGRELEGGFWSAFVACAWVGSRCTRFTAAAQAYERAKLVELGGLYASCAWIVLGNVMGERFGVTMSQASGVIKSAIADRILPAGFGLDSTTGQSREIAPAEWLRMTVVHNQRGTSLVPGVYVVSWPSVDLRDAFQTGDDPFHSQMFATPPPSAVDAKARQEAWAADAVVRNVTITDAREDAVQRLGDALAPPQDLARGLLRDAYGRAGRPVKPGRPKGSPTTHKKAFGKT